MLRVPARTAPSKREQRRRDELVNLWMHRQRGVSFTRVLRASVFRAAGSECDRAVHLARPLLFPLLPEPELSHASHLGAPPFRKTRRPGPRCRQRLRNVEPGLPHRRNLHEPERRRIQRNGRRTRWRERWRHWLERRRFHEPDAGRVHESDSRRDRR